MFTACQLFGSMKMCKANQLVEKANRLRERPRGLEKAHGVRTRRRARLWKGCRKGGPRHFSKPYVDNGLVFSVLQDNKELLQDLKDYECISKLSRCQGFGTNPSLVERFSEVGKLRRNPFPPPSNNLIKLLSESPELNTSGHSGQGWANLRMERISASLWQGSNINTCKMDWNCWTLWERQKLWKSWELASPTSSEKIQRESWNNMTVKWAWTTKGSQRCLGAQSPQRKLKQC